MRYSARLLAGFAGLAVCTGAIVSVSTPAAAAVSSHNPVGRVDAVSIKDAVVSFAGWAVDPDTAGTVRIVVKIDSVPVSSVLANGSRPDVAKVHPSFGPNRGFVGSVTMPSGNHTVCLVAGDLAIGDDTTLACKAITVPAGVGPRSIPATKRPYGFLDAVSFAGGKLTVRGWTIDPDTSQSLLVDVMVNGNSYGSAVANLARADVAKVHPGFGTNHGYSYSVPAALGSGNYEVCVVAVNDAAGGNTILPCHILTVLPTTEPASLQTATARVAAAAIQAQAIASGAVPASAFPTNYTAAARIAVATRALLQQATGRSTKPTVRSGVPAFVPASPTRVTDTQAVMGRTPSLGTYPASTTGGRSGAAHALELFGGVSLPQPNAPGDGVVGAAAILPSNGSTVHPYLPPYPTGSYRALRAEVAVTAALSHLGDPYVWAASGPLTFDCSGLTEWAYARAGINLYHYTGAQAVEGVRVKPNQLLPGDLVLFGSDLHHVGMYLGAGYMIDAPYTGAYVRIDRISDFGDFSLAVRQ
jgi:cell wall-associated NlpC family hydrolase